MDDRRWFGAQRVVQRLPVVRGVVQVPGVGPAGQQAAQMIGVEPGAAGLLGNGEGTDTGQPLKSGQALAQGEPPGRIGPVEAERGDFVGAGQQLQDVERPEGGTAVGRIGKKMGEEEQPGLAGQTAPPLVSAVPPYRLPLTAYRLPPYRLPLTAYRLPLTAYRLPLTAYRLPPANIPVSNVDEHVMGYGIMAAAVGGRDIKVVEPGWGGPVHETI